MRPGVKELIAMTAAAMFSTGAPAQTAKDIVGPSPLVAIENEPAARLIVDPPLAEQLSKGLVFIQYRTENLRVVPVFGTGALDVSPRIGHVHITVDDAPGTLSTPAAKRSSLSAWSRVHTRFWSSLQTRPTTSSTNRPSVSKCPPAARSLARKRCTDSPQGRFWPWISIDGRFLQRQARWLHRR